MCWRGVAGVADLHGGVTPFPFGVGERLHQFWVWELLHLHVGVGVPSPRHFFTAVWCGRGASLLLGVGAASPGAWLHCFLARESGFINFGCWSGCADSSTHRVARMIGWHGRRFLRRR